ncbi:hypothetical protein [Fimbriimonas ginsengisoli]|uniref:DUF5060 domain-containing protein n=1 Tax=Fimbriimonas ginsengisoli Gsoil 348 TaxID=661478 RepID=A0A068NTR7_FIMGI|nr:hypothetical protein [Fimbriimonas ginsengisoli]AIE86757.1 hypothetical protein OP10G_3389 [Fimbriimonas ginsengisoli Gsoil 348]
MLTAVIATISVAQSLLPAKWYGPVSATFNVEFDGNPYDPAENDVRVKFLPSKGEAIERLAYFDGHGAWKATLVAPIAGKYQATLYRNGRKSSEPAEEGVIEALEPLKEGFIHPDTAAKNRFRRDTGQPYYPLGFDLGWQNANFLPMTEQIAKMGKNGVNWTRIWSTSWDGRNPWWPQGDDFSPTNQLWVPALDKWQTLEDACDSNRVNFQFVLFNHGSFSSKVNPNWPDHPWNAKKGGFLKDAADFFTDAEAKRRTKMWLRYAVARYGASPHLMSWELFNEVEWVDARYANRWGDISAWHKEMAEYLRSIDPYHHMVTTSSAMDQPALWAAMDYVQPHTYPSSVLAAIYGADLPKDKPGFFGEFGSGDGAGDPHKVVRDGMYGAMLANQAGTGMFWYWDAVENSNLYPDFATAAKIVEASGLADHPTARKLDLAISTAGSADLTFAPGGGWEATKRTRLALPQEAGPAFVSGISSYLQGTNHRDMFPQPLSLTFTAPKPGRLRLTTTGTSKGGAALKITINGKVEVNENFPPASEDGPGRTFEAPYPAGPVTVEIANDGPDWVRVGSVTITGAGAQASAMGLGESDWLLLRFLRADGVSQPVTASVAGISLSDGDYDVTTFDVASGAEKTERKAVKGFKLVDWPISGPDQVLVFKRR